MIRINWFMKRFAQLVIVDVILAILIIEAHWNKGIIFFLMSQPIVMKDDPRIGRRKNPCVNILANTTRQAIERKSTTCSLAR